MTKNIVVAPAAAETDLRFTRILSRSQFKPLRDVLNHLAIAVPELRVAVMASASYPAFLEKVGYRLDVVRQIHENDCYTRLGPTGGIRAVLPVHDAATYSTMVTLVNFNSSVTTTSNSVVFYDRQLAEFKVLLASTAGE